MNLLRYLLSPKLFVPALALVLTGIVGHAIVSQSPVTAASCDPSDIVKCGYTSPTQLANTVAGNGELQKIYNHPFVPGFGIGDLNNFKANAKHATYYKNGNIVLDDGTIVATGSASLGRTTTGNPHAIMIGTDRYYWGYANTAIGPDHLDGHVLINQDDHSMKFGVMSVCGNPIWGNTSGYKCQMLNQEKVNDTTYNYSTTVYQKNATLTKLVYEFSDGARKEVTGDFGQKISHTYAPGKHTARVTAYFSVNGQGKDDTRADCTKTVEVPEPPKPVYVCDSLTLIQNSRTKFTFTVKGKSERATFKDASFDFGDKQTADHIKGTAETVTVSHEYAKEGTYTVKAYLTYNEGTTKETAKCVVNVKVVPETCKDKPNAPECKTCDNTTPKPPECLPKTCENTTPKPPECSTPPPKDCNNTPSMPQCQQPHVLPSTGPAEIIGSALGLGSIAGAGMYYRSSRRNLIDHLLKR